MFIIRRFADTFVLLSLLAACAAPPPSAATPTTASVQDPIAMIDALHVATNKHDIDASLAFFTPEAVVQLPNQPPPNVYKGAVEIRKWLEADAARNIHVSTEDVQVKDDRATWTAKVDIDDLRPLGITLVGNVEVIMRDGKIASFSFVLNDDTLAKLQAIPTPTPAKS